MEVAINITLSQRSMITSVLITLHTNILLNTGLTKIYMSYFILGAPTSKEVSQHFKIWHTRSWRNVLKNICIFFINILLNVGLVSDLHNKSLCNGELSKRNLFKLLETATSESSFIFDYLLYKQVDGVAMGFPLGPILANAFLCHYEKE